ncbi:transcriptional regulator [Candidatus Woesearchaeota archaeon]|nr:transcriptional regulator [Candidatus Woesearchaeota archaeon]
MTRREEIEDILKKGARSAFELSEIFDTTVPEIVEDLEHIRLSAKDRFRMIPAQCMECGFRFKERSRLKTPSKCPRCRSMKIKDCMFRIV